jgi:hypothetical protein
LTSKELCHLVGINAPRWESRSHFFAITAQLIRQILADHARRHRAEKRGAGVNPISLDDTVMLMGGSGERHRPCLAASRNESRIILSLMAAPCFALSPWWSSRFRKECPHIRGIQTPGGGAGNAGVIICANPNGDYAR